MKLKINLDYLHCLVYLFLLFDLIKCEENAKDWDKEMAETKLEYEKSVLKLAEILSKDQETQDLRPELSKEEIFNEIKNKLMDMYGNATAYASFMEKLQDDKLSPSNRAKITKINELSKRTEFLERKQKNHESNEEYIRGLITQTSELYERLSKKEILNLGEPCIFDYQKQRDKYLSTFSKYWFMIDEKEMQWDKQLLSSDLVLKFTKEMLQDPELKFCRWRKLLYCSQIAGTCNCLGKEDASTNLGLKYDIILKRQGNSCVIPQGQTCPPPDFRRGRKTPFPTDGTFASIEDFEVPLECEKGTSCIVEGSDLDCSMDNIVEVNKLNDLPSVVNIFAQKLCSCKTLNKENQSSSIKDEL